MSNSYEDWHKDCMVQASDMTIDNPAVSQVLKSGLLKLAIVSSPGQSSSVFLFMGHSFIIC
jgi:hypothetical protein